MNTIFEMTMSTTTWGLTVQSETRISFFQKNFFYYFMYMQFKIWLIRKIRLTDTQFLYTVNITKKIPNFNTEYQAMSLQCRKSFEFENSKFSNCLPCAKKKHMAKWPVCRVPHAAHGKVERRQPPLPLRPPPFATSAHEWHVHEVCRVFWGRHTAKIVICRVFSFCRVFLGLAQGKEAILPCAWGLPCVLFWAHGKVAVCRVPVF